MGLRIQVALHMRKVEISWEITAPLSALNEFVLISYHHDNNGAGGRLVEDEEKTRGEVSVSYLFPSVRQRTSNNSSKEELGQRRHPVNSSFSLGCSHWNGVKNLHSVGQQSISRSVVCDLFLEQKTLENET